MRNLKTRARRGDAQEKSSQAHAHTQTLLESRTRTVVFDANISPMYFAPTLLTRLFRRSTCPTVRFDLQRFRCQAKLRKLAHVSVLVSCFRTSQRAFKPLGSFPMAFLVQQHVRISCTPQELRLWPFQIQTSQRSVDLDAVGQCHGPFGLRLTPLGCLNFEDLQARAWILFPRRSKYLASALLKIAVSPMQHASTAQTQTAATATQNITLAYIWVRR